MRAFAERRVRRVTAVVMGVATIGILTGLGGGAGAVTGGSISPTVLSASQQQFTVNYTGKDPNPATPNLIVEECIADDTKVGFDPDFDCSQLSRMNFNNVAAPDGSVSYGGDPANPTAPFVGIDPNNSEWSLCDPGSGVPNYQTGFLRVADFPSDQADDLFIPFTCQGAPPATTTTTVPATTTTVVTDTTTTTLGQTTTTTLGDGTTTTTSPDATTTTTTATGLTTTTIGDAGGSGSAGGSGDGTGGSFGDALARTGSGPGQLVKLALLLLYVGFGLTAWGGSRRGQARGWPGTAPRRGRGLL